MDFHDSGHGSPGAEAPWAEGGIDPLIAALTRPIAALETRYRAAGQTVTEIIEDLSLLSARTGGRDVSPAVRVPPPSEPVEERPPLGRPQVAFDDEEMLLDFQVAVAALPGVRSVTTLGKRGNQLTLLVELGSPADKAGGSAGAASSNEEQPTLVFSLCDTVLAEGGHQLSHGLCPQCAGRFQEMRHQ